MVFVGLLSSLNVYFRAFSLAIFYLAIVMLVFLFCSAFHKAPLILNAYIWRWVLGGGGRGGIMHLLVPSAFCGFVLVSIS